MKAKVIGYILAETKKGAVGTNLYVEVPHDTYKAENAMKAVGNACESEYIRGDYSSILKVGQTVELIYGKGYEGKAVLREIVPVSEK